MPKADVTPNCRYGHGPLHWVNKQPDFPQAFGLVGLGGMGKEPESVMLALDVFECLTCGYTELFEAEKTHE